MGELILVLGGVRSGKSKFAEELARAHCHVTYLATAQPGDAEMQERIARHQRRRTTFSPAWQTIEEPWNVVNVVRGWRNGEGLGSADRCLLVECLTLWLTNLLVGMPDRSGLSDDGIAAQVAGLAQACRAGSGRVIIVSNETGCGIIPDNAMARRFSDLQGEANQYLAKAATEVHLCVAGIPMRLK